MKSKTKILLGSTLTIAMCASLITGSTLALFTSESKTNIAVTSGKVDVTAQVTDLWTYSNAEENIPFEDIAGWVGASEIEGKFTGTFTTGGTATYSVTDGAGTLALDKIAPGDAVKFTFSVANESTVSVKYQIRMLTEKDEYVGALPDPYDGTKLSSALEVKIGDEAPRTGLVYAYAPWSAVIEAGKSISETDIIIRLPKDAGNQYQERSCSITLTVLAVQGNARETSYCQEIGRHEYVNDVCSYCGEPNPFKNHHTEVDGQYVINGVDEGVTELYIPAELNGLPVKFAPGAFEKNTTITSVLLDEGITELVDPGGSPTKWGAFADCTNLTSVTLPSTLTKINRYSFRGCTKLKEITIPENVRLIDDTAFYNSGLERVQFSEGLQEIDKDAFGSTKLTRVEIPDSVTTIGRQAFKDCLELESVKIGNGLTKIEGNGGGDRGVFYGCSKLRSVEIGDSVTSIGEYAFQHCDALQWLVLPNGLETFESLSSYASITDIYFKGTRDEWAAKSFAADIGTITVHCTNAGDEHYWDGNVSKLP